MLLEISKEFFFLVKIKECRFKRFKFPHLKILFRGYSSVINIFSFSRDLMNFKVLFCI